MTDKIQEVRMCPSAEALEEQFREKLDKEFAEHGDRAQQVLAKLQEKGLRVSLRAELCFSSWTEPMVMTGAKLVNRKVERAGWFMEFVEPRMIPKYFESLSMAIDHLERTFLFEPSWGPFDQVFEDRLERILLAAKAQRKQVRYTFAHSSNLPWSMVIIGPQVVDNREQEVILVSHAYKSFTQMLGSAENHFNLNGK